MSSHRLFIRAFTDGACKGNPGLGGWGWVAFSNKKEWARPIQWSNWGGLKKTTNQQMELQAMAEFLEFCPLGCKAEVWSDSMYVLGGITGTVEKAKGATHSKLVLVEARGAQGWLNGWVAARYDRGSFGGLRCRACPDRYWKRNPKPKNAEEWYRINERLLEHGFRGSEIRFGWTKGHAGVDGNEIADALANLYPAAHK